MYLPFQKKSGPFRDLLTIRVLGGVNVLLFEMTSSTKAAKMKKKIK
uniref:ATP synthase F0 subunit 8 n=1 Tax=Platevindex mortoni TaxID=637517 RepID=D3YHQ4_9EUPU|nr:ATP synthase F0 subunit 8 [Platevindex mortoni]ADD37174.1 ATP synthase F0 subunit 8 [Platevindex mortoni]UZH97746.1 ATP synthase F0 subunit 8 [Platevindex mortoni]